MNIQSILLEWRLATLNIKDRLSNGIFLLPINSFYTPISKLLPLMSEALNCLQLSYVIKK